MTPEYFIQALAKSLVEGSVDLVPTLAISPVVWEPDGAGGRRWYFSIATNGADGFGADQVCGPTGEAVERVRAGLRFEILGRYRPVVLHDFDDELEMARWCAAQWPCAKSSKILANVELECMPTEGRA